MHPWLAIFLAATPSKHGRSLRIFCKLHIDCLLFLSSSGLVVCGHNLYLRISIVSSVLSSLQNYSVLQTSYFLMPPVNTFPSSLYISHSLTLWFLLLIVGPQGHIIAATCSSSRGLEYLILCSGRFRCHTRNCSISYFALSIEPCRCFRFQTSSTNAPHIFKCSSSSTALFSSRVSFSSLLACTPVVYPASHVYT